ncbi:MAG: PAS domain S-box protein [Desulfobulbaceae bacterium]|nr:PAS domain S-box protein [Desulfobulbaceae bacterium]
MNTDIHTLFQLAAKFFYRKYRDEGGVLNELAAQVDITPTYLSAVINGSRVCSLDLQSRIAKAFYGQYDKFIGVGRRIAEGKEPLEDEFGNVDNAEKFIAQLTHLMMDYKRIDEELNTIDQRFKKISLTSNDIYFELDENLRVRFVFGRTADIVGVAEKDLIGKNINKFYTKKEWKRLEGLIDYSIQNHTHLNTVLTVNRDGRNFYHHCVARPVYESGNLFSGFRGTYRDITGSKLLEYNLRDEQSLFQSVIESIEEHAIVITDKNNKILRWNKTYQKMMGFPLEMIEKQKIPHNPALLKQNVKNIENFRERVKEVPSIRRDKAHYFETDHGKIIERKTSPVFRDNVFAGMVTFFSDVTGKIDRRSSERTN